LEKFDADFRVEATDGASFTGHFVDGRIQRGERFSVGQRVMLATAFRVAVNFVYAELGFLALDEPTAFLDADYIRAFEPVLERLRSLSRSRGWQCVLVTHERELAPLFDSVVQ